MQFAGAYGETGVRYTLAVAAGDAQVLSRQVRPWQGAHFLQRKPSDSAVACPSGASACPLVARYDRKGRFTLNASRLLWLLHKHGLTHKRTTECRRQAAWLNRLA